MGDRLFIDVQEHGDLSYVYLHGVIDEDNGLLESIDRIAKPTVVINTADMRRINSCGVRDWVNWLSELGRKGATIYLTECSPAVMSQVNLVHNFVASGTIISFYAPYFCSSCDTTSLLLLKTAEMKKAESLSAPACRCDQCDNLMEFDDIESSYFSFLATAADIHLDEKTIVILKEIEKRGSQARLRPPAPTPVMPAHESSTPSLPSVSLTPSNPSHRELGGLFSSSRESLSDLRSRPQPLPSTSSWTLIIIIGVLSVAIIILAFIVLKIL